VAMIFPVPGSRPLLAVDSFTAKPGEPVASMVIDSDRNGYVSYAQVYSVSAEEKRIDIADTNRDGLLDKDESVELVKLRTFR